VEQDVKDMVSKEAFITSNLTGTKFVRLSLSLRVYVRVRVRVGHRVSRSLRMYSTACQTVGLWTSYPPLHESMTMLTSISSGPLEQRVTMIEKPFVRLLSLLAHHPDFETTGADDLIAMSQ
jgi:hypothetical protein